MGRPVNKRYFGDPATADTADKPLNDTFLNIRVEADTGNGAVDTAFIVSQRGTNKFKVNDGTSILDCRLVDKGFGDIQEGEMVIFGTDGTGSRIPIKKLFNRTAVDFNNQRYTWVIQDDSTETAMILTEI